MPEIAEPPTKPDYVPPQVPEAAKEPLKVSAGEKYKAEFEKLTKATETTETPKEEPPKEVKETEVPAKPASPLDVITSDKKTEVKLEEPDVLKDIPEDIETKDPKQKANWKSLREAAKTLSTKLKETEGKLTDLSKAPKAAPEEIASIQKERDQFKQKLAEREEVIKSIDVRLSDEYRSLAKKRDDTLGKIASRAKSYGVDADILVSALALPEGRFKSEQIKAAMAEVDADDKGRINVLIEALDGHNEALVEFEKDAPKKYEEIQAKRETAMREQQESSIKNMETEFGKITESLPNDVVTLREVPDDVPGAEDWNKAIREARDTALRVLKPNGADFNESARIAVQGAHYPAIVEMFLKDHSELVDARKRLAEYDSGGPDFKGSSKPKNEPKLTPSQRYHKAMEAQTSGSTDV